MDIKFLLRKNTGDQPIGTEAELHEIVRQGHCLAADFLYDFSAQKWGRAADHPSLAAMFAEKPAQIPDRRVIYFVAPGASANSPQGPYSPKEVKVRAQNKEICASTWVFVEGDKEWRQVKNVKALNDMLPALPTDRPAVPAAPAAAAAPPPFSASVPATPASAPPGGSSAQPELELSLGATDFSPTSVAAKPEREMPSMPSITLDFGGASSGATAADPGLASSLPPAGPPAKSFDDDSHIEREEITMALDTMGLNLHSEHASLPPSPPKSPPKAGVSASPGHSVPGGPPAAPPRALSGGMAPPSISLSTPPGGTARPKSSDDGFDGIVAEIPMDPVWLVKQSNSEQVSGPFRFLEVIKFLEEGKLTKSDKIARSGTKAFVKIQQQYEFNVKYSVEMVMENGQEKQKILIRRRHPRVPYMTGVQIVSKHGLLAGQCVNISAGGILMEVPKAEFNLGEIIEVKILPGLIAKSISCKSLIIGKIPKIPPGYALKFEDLKPEDKEAIEYYVQETLKREMSKKN